MRPPSILAAIAVSVLALVLGVACSPGADAAPPAATVTSGATPAASSTTAPATPTSKPGEVERTDAQASATHEAGDSTPFGGASAGEPPAIGMPFAIGDLLDEAINPFGVVRWSFDRTAYGHSGIDLSLRFGAELVAVGDGEIVAIKPSPDPRPGLEIVLLLDGGAPAPAGEGWAFIYEHVELLDGIAAGTRVVSGQPLGTSPLTPQIGNHHVQITYLFNGYEFSRNHTCWLDQLAPDDRAAMHAAMERIGATDALRSSWLDDEREGAFTFRGLLDEERFPEGPSFCYEPGTDVRD